MKNPFKKSLSAVEQAQRDIDENDAAETALKVARRKGIAPPDAEDQLIRIQARKTLYALDLEKALDDERTEAEAEAERQHQQDIEDANKLKRSQFDAIGAQTRRMTKSELEIETAVAAVMAPYDNLCDASDKIHNLLPSPISYRVEIEGEQLRHLLRPEEILRRVLIRAFNERGLASRLPFKVSDPDAIGPVSATMKEVARAVVNRAREQLIDPPVQLEPPVVPFKPAYSEVVPEFGTPPPFSGSSFVRFPVKDAETGELRSPTAAEYRLEQKGWTGRFTEVHHPAQGVMPEGWVDPADKLAQLPADARARLRDAVNLHPDTITVAEMDALLDIEWAAFLRANPETEQPADDGLPQGDGSAEKRDSLADGGFAARLPSPLPVPDEEAPQL